MSTAFDRDELRTVHLIPLTAFDADGNINQRQQAEHTADMYAAGIRVFMTAAGTGEFHSLSADEIVDLVRITRESTGEDAVIFAPIGLQVDFAKDVAVRSMDAGASGIMFMPFSHPYMSDAGAREYYRSVMDAAGAPAMFYKKAAIPSDDLMLEMADDPRVVGVKYAVNDMHEFRKVVLADGNRIEWVCGTAERFAPYYMLAGSNGYTTGAGNLCPHLTLAMHAAFAAGEYDEGLRLQQIILPIEDYRARAGDSFNVSMLKHGMTLLGRDFGQPRAPQRQLTSAERLEIETLVKPILAADKELRSELTSVGLSKG